MISKSMMVAAGSAAARRFANLFWGELAGVQGQSTGVITPTAL
jgi:hypothetical protein